MIINRMRLPPCESDNFCAGLSISEQNTKLL